MKHEEGENFCVKWNARADVSIGARAESSQVFGRTLARDFARGGELESRARAVELRLCFG
jgi:hypothetical protein